MAPYPNTAKKTPRNVVDSSSGQGGTTLTGSSVPAHHAQLHAVVAGRPVALRGARRARGHAPAASVRRRGRGRGRAQLRRGRARAQVERAVRVHLERARRRARLRLQQLERGLDGDLGFGLARHQGLEPAHCPAPWRPGAGLDGQTEAGAGLLQFT